MFDDDLIGTILGTAAFAAMYMIGRNAGKVELKKEICESLKDIEINNLKQEIKRMKTNYINVQEDFNSY
ncbi:MAG TPA: hypothetical protein VKZ95_03725 [Sphingobacteriaceae bacterium]|nr:hypothetical protein [Sphingobacteriaceae bacterium]